MKNIVFESTTQFLKFVNEKISGKEKLYGKKNPALAYLYLEQSRIPVPVKKKVII